MSLQVIWAEVMGLRILLTSVGKGWADHDRHWLNMSCNNASACTEPALASSGQCDANLSHSLNDNG